MALNDKDLHAQGMACMEVANQNPDHPFYRRYTPMLQGALERYGVDLGAVAMAEAALRKESDQGREAAEKLRDRTSYWLGMIAIEMPHLDRAALGEMPENRPELLLFADTLVDFVQEQGQDLYIADQATEQLEAHLAAARAELGDVEEAEAVFHKAVAEKRGSKETLRNLIRTFKSGTRRIHGPNSQQYRSLRDTMFRGRGKRQPETQ